MISTPPQNGASGHVGKDDVNGVDRFLSTASLRYDGFERTETITISSPSINVKLRTYNQAQGQPQSAFAILDGPARLELRTDGIHHVPTGTYSHRAGGLPLPAAAGQGVVPIHVSEIGYR
jgi:hypothetical protein